MFKVFCQWCWRLLQVITSSLLLVIGGIVFSQLKREGRIKVIGEIPHRKFPHGLLLLSNHTRSIETAELVVLAWPRFLWRRRQWIPWSTPNAEHFSDWYWPFIIRRMILVPRTRLKGLRSALAMIDERLKTGEIILMFSEAGWTEGSDANAHQRHVFNGTCTAKVRTFRRGAAWIIAQMLVHQSSDLPEVRAIWVEHMDRGWHPWWLPQTLITISEPLDLSKILLFEKTSERIEALTLLFQKEVLALAPKK